ncbi:MAG: 5-formyltetrahydrofolate cyclo-ligase [Veillonellales bacterium]
MSLDSTTLAKINLRQDLLTARRSLAAAVVEKSSQCMARHLFDWILYQQAKTVMIYLSMPDEPQTEAIISHAWGNGKSICVPYLRETPGLMDAALISNMSELTEGRFGLKVPAPNRLQFIAPGNIELILIPGVAFDVFGNRLGMGGGYYDRFLPQASSAVLIGVCWQSYVLTNLPTAKHDRPVHFLLTEAGILSCGKGKM